MLDVLHFTISSSQQRARRGRAASDASSVEGSDAVSLVVFSFLIYCTLLQRLSSFDTAGDMHPT